MKRPSLRSCLLFCLLAFSGVGQAQTPDQSLGTDPRFTTYMLKNTRFPVYPQEQGKEGIVYACFTVTKQGEITDVSVSNPSQTDSLFAFEVSRVCRRIPDQTPSYAGHYILPVAFVLNAGKRNQANDTAYEAQLVAGKPTQKLLKKIVVEYYGTIRCYGATSPLSLTR